MEFAEAMKIQIYNSIVLLIKDGLFFFPRKCREVFLIRRLHNEDELVPGIQDLILLITWNCFVIYTIISCMCWVVIILSSNTRGAFWFLISGATYTLINKLRSF